ncbi:MAG: ATP-binding cassette domain-containing protein, partial [Ardenticatenaceae bacterium]
MSILLDNLSKSYGTSPVMSEVTLEIEDGELFVLLGASGSGKSTLLRLIAGLTTTSEGRIWLHGKDVTDLSPQARNVGFVFQNYALFRHMKVADNIEFGLAIRGVPKSE